jgi:hypothetical protein
MNINICTRAGGVGVAKVVHHLPSKHEALGSNLVLPKKKKRMFATSVHSGKTSEMWNGPNI